MLTQGQWTLSTSIARARTDGYTIARELGDGGMSRTYLAREHALSAGYGRAVRERAAALSAKTARG